jgi:hypothetical protein
MRLPLVLSACLLMTLPLHAGCVTHVSPLPSAQPDVAIAAPIGANLSASEFIHVSIPIAGGDRLLLYALHNDAPFTGYSERGILIERNGRTIHKLALSSLPELKGDPKDPDDDPSDSFIALSLTTVCIGDKTFYWLAFHWQGDIISPELLVLLSPRGQQYEFSALPPIDGGILDVSRSDPTRLRTWDNLVEGGCNACATRYEVREYGMVNNKPALRRHWRTRKLYSTSEFDDRLGVRLVH